MNALLPAEIALVVALVAGVAVSARLLLAARRTRRAPELWIGVALLFTALGGALEAVGLQAAARGAPDAAHLFDAGSYLVHAFAAAALYVAVWRVFHRHEAWARVVALVGAATTATLWLPAVPPAHGAFAEVPVGRLLFQIARGGAYAWGALEALRYHDLMRARVRLGLADSIIAHQFMLWGVASSSVVGMCILALVSEQVIGQAALAWTPSLVGITVLGVLASFALYAAFFPPAVYRRWVEQVEQGQSLLDPLVPASIRREGGDVRARARLIVLAAASAVVWGPAFVWLVLDHGSPELAAVVAAFVGLLVAQLFVLRVSGSVSLAGNLMLLGVFGFVLLGGATWGGIAAPGLEWLVVLPIGGLLLSGARSGMGWGGLSMATILGFYAAAAENGLWTPPQEQAEAFPDLRALSLMAVITVVGLVALRAFREKDRALAEMAEARDRARDAGQAKMRFLATMSHEIRTPMNGALGMTELLLRSDLTEEQRRFAESIERSGRSLLGVIDDILDFSRIESGRLRLEFTEFDLLTLLEDALDVVAEAAHAKQLELGCAVDPKLPKVMRGDPQRLRQVLLNLVGNAVKFTERGEIELKASAASEPGPDGLMRVRFEVRDTGIGIPTGVRERIFDRFMQADDSMTRRYGGTGLGLAISRHLVELMGGEIGVESEPGVGSRFWFSVPLTGVDGAVSLPRPPPVPSGCRVLVVDDNATNREILRGQLASWDVGCEAVSDGPQALEALRAAVDTGQAFDVALLDMNMPGMDGVELTRSIRAESSLAGLRLVMLTSVGPVADEETAYRAGVDAVLCKPVRQAQLGSCLGEVLSRGRAPAPPEPDPAGDSSPARDTATRVLLAEDNVVNRHVAVSMLEMLGYTVEVVGNGREALEALEARDFDLVLMDCQMPELDGLSATRRLRRREAHLAEAGASTRRLPVIALTASAMEGDRQRCLDAGMDDYLSKPFRLDQLAQALRRWVEPGAVVSDPAPDSDAAAEASSDTPVLDREALDAIRELENEADPDVLERVIDAYLASVPGLLETLRAALAADDAASLWRAAHPLKSSSAALGATRVAELARRIEEAGRSGSTKETGAWIRELESAYGAVREALLAEKPGREA